MGRSGYSCECEHLHLWRQAVDQAINGKRGQTALKELLAALDAMPDKKLIADELEENGQVCTLGALGKARGIDMSDLDVWDYDRLSEVFNIAKAMVCEIEYENDEGLCRHANPEERWKRMRQWVASQIK